MTSQEPIVNTEEATKVSRRNWKQFREARLEQVYLHEPKLLDYRVEIAPQANVFKFTRGNVGYIRKIDEEVE